MGLGDRVLSTTAGRGGGGGARVWCQSAAGPVCAPHLNPPTYTPPPPKKKHPPLPDLSVDQDLLGGERVVTANALVGGAGQHKDVDLRWWGGGGAGGEQPLAIHTHSAISHIHTHSVISHIHTHSAISHTHTH